MNENAMIREIVNRSLLAKIGSRTVLIIKRRTAKGVFLKGSSAGGEKYSTKPFVMPIGAVKKKDVMMKMLKGGYGKEDVMIFKTKGGGTWALLKKGYKWLREQSGRQSERVDLRWSGTLMRSLRVIDVSPEKGEVVIGHGEARSRKIAEYHNVSGAGKGKTIRKYLGATEKEMIEILKGL